MVKDTCPFVLFTIVALLVVFVATKSSAEGDQVDRIGITTGDNGKLAKASKIFSIPSWSSYMVSV